MLGFTVWISPILILHLCIDWKKVNLYLLLLISYEPAHDQAVRIEILITKKKKENTHTRAKRGEKFRWSRNLTCLGLLLTMSTASWLVRCSQRPSDANMINWSSGCNFSTDMVGSAVRIGFIKGSGTLYLCGNGSLLNSGLFKYTSPRDLVTCNQLSKSMQT